MQKPIKFQQIDETVFGSAEPSRRAELNYLKQHGFGVIFSLTKPSNPEFLALANEYGFKVVFRPLSHGEMVPNQMIANFIGIVNAARKSGKKVLVHCGYGEIRSAEFLKHYIVEKELAFQQAKRKNLKLRATNVIGRRRSP